MIFNCFFFFCPLCVVAEVEAVHACEWLRQAGFPQYVQMYEGEMPWCTFNCRMFMCTLKREKR